MSDVVLVSLIIVNTVVLIYAFRVFFKYSEDAKRYRWLRSQDWTKNRLSVIPTNTLKIGDNTYSNTRLDEVIDAYMNHSNV